MSLNKPAGKLWDERLRSILDASPDAIIAIDDAGAIVDWNAKANTTFLWPERVSRLRLTDLFKAEDLQEIISSIRTLTDTQSNGQRIELVARRANGNLLPVELSISRVTISDKTYFNAFVRDITEWRQEEELHSKKLLEAELLSQATSHAVTAETFAESLKRLLDLICTQIEWPFGHVWMPYDSGLMLSSSHIWHMESGLDISDFVKRTQATQFRYGEGLPGTIWKRREPVWMEESEISAMIRMRSHDGIPIRSAFGFPVIADGDVVTILEFFHTEKVEQDQGLLDIVRRVGEEMGKVAQSRRFEQQRARLAAIVDSSYDAIIGKSLDGRITSWNYGAELVYGYSAEEAVGQTSELVLPDDQENEEPEILEAIALGRRLEEFETIRVRKDGRKIAVSVTMSPVVDSTGQVVGSSTIERDITERRRAEEELQRARDSAIRASRTRAEFLANVSHELRTPMNAIIGMTSMALDEDLTPQLRDYLETANDSAHSLLTLLNDILDFSKLESGKFSIVKENFILADVVEESIKTLSSQAFAKGLELVCRIPRDLPREVIGDGIRLRQILTNLISNAIKFTDQGEIVVSVEVVRIWPDEARFRFAVKDTGIGIPVEEQQRILEPFTQVDSSSTRIHGGTGLGLAISSELLRMMGGRLSLQSEVGQGSNFSFRLSFDLPISQNMDTIDSLPFEKLRELPVLVVDDNATNRKIIAETLTTWGMKPITANDAQQAIGILRQNLENDMSFPLIIVDALMPGMDGYELSREVRKLRPDSESPVILMVSSADRKEFRENEASTDIAAFVQKPVTQTDLIRSILRAMRLATPQAPPPTTAAGSGQPLASLSVLLAEDTPANQKVVTTMLKKRGHSVTVAQNGREAVELFKKQTFDVVLMDVQMPILDGFQATSVIRALERDANSATPIIAMTAHAMRGDREKCLEAGMDAYVAKPLDVKQLLGLIESVAEDRFATQANQHEVDDSFSSHPTPIIDYAGAMKRLGNDAELFQEFIVYYDEDARQLVQQIEEAIQTKATGDLHRAAHNLKGLAANLGAQRVVNASYSLERIGKNGELAKAAEALRLLQSEMERLDAALQNYRP
ncbi:Signal transduction histidine-protein kinase BarA [Bremerella volcania]|uniref:Sensory/regulatory protein RpfC n=1 Tax=Bremerella volcania TaxID=2527984 RepID=A0A518C9K5_9BACT|nr:response regulator [Bremerella volcania]QDU75908.1 Signal transduction histidine-protein kinase BarA [Bremerella volcania]